MNTAAPFNLTPVNGVITVESAHPAGGHHAPGTAYTRGFWVSELGPTAYLAWEQLVAWCELGPVTV